MVSPSEPRRPGLQATCSDFSDYAQPMSTENEIFSGSFES